MAILLFLTLLAQYTGTSLRKWDFRDFKGARIDDVWAHWMEKDEYYAPGKKSEQPGFQTAVTPPGNDPALLNNGSLG